MIVNFYIGGVIMGIIDNFLIKSVKNNDIKSIKLTLSLCNALTIVLENSFQRLCLSKI